jgi:hypothetical protein
MNLSEKSAGNLNRRGKFERARKIRKSREIQESAGNS